MKFSATVVLAAAMGASAHPSRHAHHNAHRSVVGREFVMAQRPSPPAPAATTVAPSPSAPEVSAASSSSASSSPGSGFKPFCGGNKKRATLAQIAYAGNTGGSGKYGCNIMQIDSSAASSYDYTMKFVNNGGSEEACTCWNKIGPDGGINGFFKNNQAMDFKLPANGEAYVAVDGNSQIGCACGPGEVPTTFFGQFASTWVEADFGNESNNKWSGFDASALVSAANGLDIPALKVCDDKTCSTIFKGGKGDNAYVGGMEADDGVGGNVAPGPLALTVTVN
ncbi:Allergen Asp f 4 [Beauveria bassiana]|nr:Allergen Asp f 4 [Beauveria bassiana]KAH8712645.1 Allergen Asp f 4 [Beauveria bassiana]